MKHIAVLTSGHSRGSNFEAIVRYLADKPVQVAFVVVTSHKAPIIERAARLGIPALYIPAKDVAAFERQLLSALTQHEVKLLAFAGFMRKLSVDFLQTCPCQVVNIHPALLPNYGGEGMYGIRVHEAVFAAGEKVSGATVHHVNGEYDAGEVISQRQIDISACQSPEEVAGAVLNVEHELYPETIWELVKRL